jgi:hypothetical protein
MIERVAEDELSLFVVEAPLKEEVSPTKKSDLV